jgi:hypothetical protein
LHDVDIEAIASKFNSVTVVSLTHRFDASIASNDVDIQAIASEFGSGAMSSLMRQFYAIIASNGVDMEVSLHHNLIVMQWF